MGVCEHGFEMLTHSLAASQGKSVGGPPASALPDLLWTEMQARELCLHFKRVTFRSSCFIVVSTEFFFLKSIVIVFGICRNSNFSILH